MQFAPPRTRFPVTKFVEMLSANFFIWNVCGLNSRARRSVVREFLNQECVSALCLFETKVDVLTPSMACDLMGMAFDYVCLPSVGVSGGIIVAWRRDMWVVSVQTCRTFSITVTIAPSMSPAEP